MSSPSKAKAPKLKPFQPKYTDEDRARFFEKFKELKGNVRQASKAAGVSEDTARYWIKRASPESDLETWDLIRRKRGSIENKVDELIFKMLASIERKVPKATVKDATGAVEVLVRIQNAMRRPPRPGASTDPIGPSSDEAEAMAILEKARKRVNEQVEDGLHTEET